MNLDCKNDPNDYFDDGIRKIDFILVWKKGKPFEFAFFFDIKILDTPSIC